MVVVSPILSRTRTSGLLPSSVIPLLGLGHCPPEIPRSFVGRIIKDSVFPSVASDNVFFAFSGKLS